MLIAGTRHRAHRNRTITRVLLGLMLGSLLALGGGQSASAHAQLLSTTPEDGVVLEEAPAEAVLRFNEPVRLLDDAIRLFPGDEAPIHLDAQVVGAVVTAALPETLADGRYALSYRVVSADGHPLSGAISFAIGDPSGAASDPRMPTGTPDATLFILYGLTFLQYLGLLVFAGLLFFDRVVRRIPGPVGGRSRIALLAAGIVAAAASVLLIPISALNVTGRAPGALLSPAVWWSGVLWPMVAAAVMVLVGTGTGTLAALHRIGHARSLSVAAAFVALAGPVLVGHSMLVEPRALVVAAELGHLVTAGFWVGGVVGLLLLLAEASPAGRRSPTELDPLPAVAVVRRFSRYAIWSVLLLAISGTVMGIMIVGSLDALFATGYGLTLLFKLGIVACVIAVAGYNRSRLLPAVLRQPTARQGWRTLHRTLGYEAALLVVVLAVTGVLTNRSPADTAAGSSPAAVTQTIHLHETAQQLTVDGTFSPVPAGESRLAFTLRYQGQVVAPESVTVRATLPEQDLGPFQSTPELRPDTGEYTALLDLPAAGDWELRIIARVSAFAEPIVTIPVTLR